MPRSAREKSRDLTRQILTQGTSEPSFETSPANRQPHTPKTTGSSAATSPLTSASNASSVSNTRRSSVEPRRLSAHATSHQRQSTSSARGSRVSRSPGSTTLSSKQLSKSRKATPQLSSTRASSNASSKGSPSHQGPSSSLQRSTNSEVLSRSSNKRGFESEDELIASPETSSPVLRSNRQSSDPESSKEPRSHLSQEKLWTLPSERPIVEPNSKLSFSLSSNFENFPFRENFDSAVSSTSRPPVVPDTATANQPLDPSDLQTASKMAHSPMPARNSKDAPSFKTDNPADIELFFFDFNEACTVRELSQTEKYKQVIRYIDQKARALWIELKTYGIDGGWDAFETEVIGNYIADTKNRYSLRDAENIVERTSEFGSTEEFLQYHRDITQVIRFLEKGKKISEEEGTRIYFSGFKGQLSNRRLQIVFDLHPGSRRTVICSRLVRGRSNAL